MDSSFIADIKKGSFRALARSISLVENEATGYEDFLKQLTLKNNCTIIGITGAPGSGKSTLVDALINDLIKLKKRIGILCVDPSSPFNLGALLGDRVRMSKWYNNENVFIRSLATRGSLGGLNPKIIEITDVMKAADFDYIIVETVGVGQSEIEIAGLADITVVVMVPEGGDEIQTMKAGLMEIADVFVVNKSDRPDADIFVKNLRLMLAPAFTANTKEIPIIKTVAIQHEGIDDLVATIVNNQSNLISEKKMWLLTEKAFLMLQQQRMKDISKQYLHKQITKATGQPNFNLYNFVQDFKTGGDE
jgi:LAO/AO transport system kinase